MDPVCLINSVTRGAPAVEERQVSSDKVEAWPAEAMKLVQDLGTRSSCSGRAEDDTRRSRW